MSYGAECLAKIRQIFSFTEVSGQKRRADNIDLCEPPKLTKYRRVTNNCTEKPLPPIPITDFSASRRIKDFYQKFKQIKHTADDNLPTSVMGINCSNHKTHNNTDTQPYLKPQHKQIQPHSKINHQLINYNCPPININNRHNNTDNSHRNIVDLIEDDEDEIMFLQEQQISQSINKPVNSINQQQINFTDSNISIKPSSLKRTKLSRIPDLHPIIKPKSRQTSTNELLSNGTITPPTIIPNFNKPNTSGLIKGISNEPLTSLVRPINYKTSFSLRKNISAANKQPSSIRSFMPATNSINSWQHNLEEKRHYAELLRKIIPDFNVDNRDSSNQRNSINRKRTDTEIFQDLRNSAYFNDIQLEKPDESGELTKVEAVNTMRPKVETKPEYHDLWLDNLNEKYSNMKLQKNETISEEILRVEQRRQETKEKEKIYQNRMVKDWNIKHVIVLDDSEEDEENEFPEITSQMMEFIMKSIKGPVSHVLIEKFNIKITCFDIETLYWEPDFRWLNDEVINFYMNLLMERSEQHGKDNGWPLVHVMNTFFIQRLMQGGYTVVRRWTRKVDIFAFDLMPIPVHVGGVHWTLAMVDFKQKTVKYYDSMGSPNQQVLDLLKMYLREESLDKRKIPLDLSQWCFETATNIPRQGNGSDCGVFTCMFAEYISRNKQITFTQKHMHYFRMKMIYEICTGKLMF